MKINEYYRDTAHLNLNGSIASLLPVIIIIAGNLTIFKTKEINSDFYTYFYVNSIELSNLECYYIDSHLKGEKLIFDDKTKCIQKNFLIFSKDDPNIEKISREEYLNVKNEIKKDEDGYNKRYAALKKDVESFHNYFE